MTEGQKPKVMLSTFTRINENIIKQTNKNKTKHAETIPVVERFHIIIEKATDLHFQGWIREVTLYMFILLFTGLDVYFKMLVLRKNFPEIPQLHLRVNTWSHSVHV